MTTWVALLRGVNVNGVTVKSAELGALFRDLGFDSVGTFLASGNVRFEAEVGVPQRAPLKVRVEQGLRDRFGYDAWIVLVTLDELRSAVQAFPFDATDEDRQPYVVFVSDPAVFQELTDASAQADPVEDPARAGDGVLYWSPERGRSLDTGFAKLLARTRYRTSTTTRNLRTLEKIVGVSP